MHGTCVFLHVNFCMEAGLQEERTSALGRELRICTHRETCCHLHLGLVGVASTLLHRCMACGCGSERAPVAAGLSPGAFWRWRRSLWQKLGDGKCAQSESTHTQFDVLCMPSRRGW